MAPKGSDKSVTGFNEQQTSCLKICRLNSTWASMDSRGGGLLSPREPPTVPLWPPRADTLIQITVIEGNILQENGHSEKKMTRKKLSKHVLCPVILYSISPYCLKSCTIPAVVVWDIYLSSCSQSCEMCLQNLLFYFFTFTLFITALCVSMWCCVSLCLCLSKHFVAIKSLFCFNSYCSTVPWDLCWFWQTVCGDFLVEARWLVR